MIFTEVDENALDYQILRDGSISIYRNFLYLGEDIEWLRQNHYRVYSLTCTTWVSEQAMHESLQEALLFPAYYGRNLNAFKDCMSDLDVPDEGGVVIVLTSYDAYVTGFGPVHAHSKASEAEAVLDILAETSRYMLLTGKRLITLVQSNDPLIQFEKLGGVSAKWNRREWLNKNRGV